MYSRGLCGTKAIPVPGELPFVLCKVCPLIPGSEVEGNFQPELPSPRRNKASRFARVSIPTFRVAVVHDRSGGESVGKLVCKAPALWLRALHLQRTSSALVEQPQA